MVETIDQNKEQIIMLRSGETFSEILTDAKEIEHFKAIYEGLCLVFHKNGENYELSPEISNDFC